MKRKGLWQQFSDVIDTWTRVRDFEVRQLWSVNVTQKPTAVLYAFKVL